MADRKSRIELVAGLTALGLIVAAGAAVAVYREEATARGLGIDAADLDFGSAWERTDFPWTVTVRNHWDEPVTLTDFSASCRCTAVQPRSFTVPAGGAVPVALTLDLSSAFGGGAAAEAAFSVRLIPTLAGGPMGQPGWELKGTAARPVVFQPPMLELEAVRGRVGRPVTVQVTPQMAAAGLRIIPPAFLASAELSAPDADGVRRLTATASGDAGIGVQHGELQLELTGVSGSADGLTARLPVRVRIIGPVAVLPEAVTFGALRRGTTATQTVLLTATEGTDTFHVAAVRSAPGFAATGTDLDRPAVRHRLDLTCDTAAPGLRSGGLEIDLLTAADEPFTLRLPLSAYVLDLPATPPVPLEAPRPPAPTEAR